jgi:hypothetical protein
MSISPAAPMCATKQRGKSPNQLADPTPQARINSTLETISMLRATFWSLSFCALSRWANAEPSVSVTSPPAIAIMSMVDSAKCAEVLIGTSFGPFNVVPPLPPVREVVDVQDKTWIHEFAALIRTGVDVTPARWGAFIIIQNAPVVFVLPDGRQLTLLSV